MTPETCKPFSFVFRLAVALMASAALFLSPAALAAGDGWNADFAEARSEASASEKDLLLLFTGSDWCPPCMDLEQRVLSQEGFLDPVGAGFVPVVLDFPTNKPQPPATRQQNLSLQDRYQIQGYPTLVLTDSAGRAYAIQHYDRDLVEQGPGAFAAQVMELRGVRHERDSAFAAAQGVVGVDRAWALDRGLRAVGKELATAHYIAEMNEVVELDPDNAAGLKQTYRQLLNMPMIESELAQAVERLRANELQKGLDGLKAIIVEYEPHGEVLQTLEYVRAQAYSLQKEHGEADRAFKRAIAAAPESPGAENIRRIMHQVALENGLR